MGLLRSLKTKFSSGRKRKEHNSVGLIPSLSHDGPPVSRRDSVARKPLPARARVEPDVLSDSYKPATPPKDEVQTPTIRLIGNEDSLSKTESPTNAIQSHTKLDPRTYWGADPSLDRNDNTAGSELQDGEKARRGVLHNGDDSNDADLRDAHNTHNHELRRRSSETDGGLRASNEADATDELALKTAGINLKDSVDTDYNVAHAPAVTHETIHNQTTEIVQESITREIHEHDHYHYIQPVRDVEVLPERHFMRDINGHLFEIPAPSGHEIIQPVVGETYVDMAMLPKRS